MNRIYRTVFNRALGVWQAVPEKARARGKPSGGRTATATALLSALMLTLGTTPAAANEIIDNGDHEIVQNSSWNIAGNLTVGNLGTGELTIADGGTVSNNYGYIGRGGGSTGTVTVRGENSSWVNSNTLHVGRTGTGDLTIRDGVRVQVNNGTGVAHIGYATSATGTINIGAAAGDDPAAAGSLEAGTVAFGNGSGRLIFNHTDND